MPNQLQLFLNHYECSQHQEITLEANRFGCPDHSLQRMIQCGKKTILRTTGDTSAILLTIHVEEEPEVMDQTF